jgi:hypothetical protein
MVTLKMRYVVKGIAKRIQLEGILQTEQSNRNSELDIGSDTRGMERGLSMPMAIRKEGTRKSAI